MWDGYLKNRAGCGPRAVCCAGLVYTVDGIILQTTVEFKPLQSINEGGMYSMQDIEPSLQIYTFSSSTGMTNNTGQQQKIFFAA